MKKIKFIDLETKEEEVEFGTCEMCFSTGTVDNPVLNFKVVKEDGSEESLSINGYEWSWGDYSETSIANLVDFAVFLTPLEFDDSVEFDRDWLWKIARCYNTLNRLQHPTPYTPS
jgi:hypothetical protein